MTGSERVPCPLGYAALSWARVTLLMRARVCGGRCATRHVDEVGMTILAVWAALIFAVVAAYSGQRSFMISTENEAPEPWPGAPEFVYDVPEYILERRGRERRRRLAAGWQSMATYCGIATALEAVGAAQDTLLGHVAAFAGIAIALAGVAFHSFTSREEYLVAGAQAVYEAFSIKYKLGFPPGITEDEMFAFKHPAAWLVLNEPRLSLARIRLLVTRARALVQ